MKIPSRIALGSSNLGRQLTLSLLFAAGSSLAHASPITDWTLMDTGTTSDFGSLANKDSSPLSVYSSNFAVVTAADGLTRTYDGTSWEVIPGNSTPSTWGYQRSSVAITSPTRVYIATYGTGTADTRRLLQPTLSGDPLEWSWTNGGNNRPTGANARLTGVWTDPDPAVNRVVVGTLQNGIRWSNEGGGGTGGSGWTATLDHNDDPVTDGTWYPINGSSSGSLILADSTGSFHLSSNDGVSIGASFATLANFGDINGFYTLGENAIWTVGQAGRVDFWNGITFASQDTPTTNNLQAVYAIALDNVYAVGSNNTILHYDGVVWSEVDPGLESTVHFTGIGADQLGSIFISGTGGTMLYGAIIPEPRVYALIGGLLALGAAMTLRRRP